MLTHALSSLLPPRCPGCLASNSSGDALCPVCLPLVHALELPLCQSCGGPLAHGEVCPECRQKDPPWRHGLSLFPYNGPIAAAIRLAKYGGHPWIFNRMGILLAPTLRLFAPRWIIPIPPHRLGLAVRGFNPATKLALAMKRHTPEGVPRPYLLPILTRTREGRPQAARSRGERRSLPADTFRRT